MNIEPPTPSGQPPQPHPCAASLADALGKLLSQLSTALGDFDGVGQDLGHLEESLKKPMAQFQSRVLEAAAQRRADQAEPICPRCARPLTRRQKLARSILTSQGEIELARVRGWCGKCRAWRCPADEALGVEGGHSPLVREMAALFASKMPLAEASVALGRAAGIHLPTTTLDRVAKRAADHALAKRGQMDGQAAQGGEALARQRVAAPPSTLVVMLDAWNIRERDDFGNSKALRKKGLEPKRWRWVWMGTVFGLSRRARKGDRAMITHRGYVATRGGLEEFRAQLHAEALRHGLGQAGRVLVMGDGAAWIWNLAKDRFQGAAQRVDLYHVKEHLWAVARELRPNDPGGAELWVRRMKQRLKRGQAGKVVSSLEEAMAELEATSRERVGKEAAYLKEHVERMDYHQARKRGEPAGTGAIESTCRQYQCRFKRPGQFWSKTGDEGLLCLETFWRNGRWSHLFPHTKNFDPSKN